MKTRDRINTLQVTKQPTIKKFNTPPGNNVGKEGDLGIAMVPRKGLHLFYKLGGQWYGVQLNKILKSKDGIPMYDRIKFGSLVDNSTIGNSPDGLFVDMPSGAGSKIFKIERKANDGNPIIQIGSSDTECLQLVASYDSGTKGMDFIEIRTKTASGTADKAMIKILVDDVQRASIDDGGLNVTGTIDATGNITTTLGDLSIGGGDVTIKGPNDVAAKILMQADNSDDAGDDWTITANTDQTLSIGNDINSAGTPVTHIDITPHATVASSLVSVKGGLSIPAGSAYKLFLDGGVNTYLQEFGDDSVRVYVGGDIMLTLTEFGTSGNYIALGGSTGFSMIEPTYGDVVYSADSGNNTDIDFRFGNKARLELTASSTVAILGFVFPPLSGNFVVALEQASGGSGVVTAYNAYDSGGNAANGSATLLFAGGSNPTLTTTGNKTDILSIFWDKETEIAYATITQNF